MNNSIKLLNLGLVFCLASCASVFGPSRSAYDLGYTARPVYKGEKQTNVQGALQFNADNGFSQNEVQNGAEASVSVHSINEHIGYSFGGFAFTSRYKIRSADQKLGAYGYGGRFSVYRNKVAGHFHWRPYGLELGVSVEHGEFQTFRKEQPVASKVSSNTIIPSIGLSSEAVYLPDFLDNSSLGTRVVLGGSFYEFQTDSNTIHPFILVSPFLNWNRYTAYANLKFDQRFGASVGASFRL